MSDEILDESPPYSPIEDDPFAGEKPISDAMKRAMDEAQQEFETEVRSRLESAQGRAAAIVEKKKTRWEVETAEQKVDKAKKIADELIKSVTSKYYGNGHGNAHLAELKKKPKPRAPTSAVPAAIPPGMPAIPPGMPGFPPMMDPSFFMMNPMMMPPGMVMPPGMMPPPMTMPPMMAPPASTASSSKAQVAMPPPTLVAPPVIASKRSSESSKDDGSKRLRLGIPNGSRSSADDDENELFVRLLYRKLQSITNKKRLEDLHVEIMALVKKATEDSRSSRDYRW